MADRQPEFESIIDNILASYADDHTTQRIGEVFLPSQDKIITILDEIRQLLFPGFFGDQQMSTENVKFHTGDLVTHIARHLGDQICQCLCYDEHDEQPCPARADLLARRFLSEVPELRRLLALDAEAAFEGDPAAKSIDEVIYCYPGYFAVTVYRIAHALSELGVPLMPRIMSEHAHSITGADIHPGATIGERFFIDHATGVVIGETARIGNHVKLYQGVTLGARSFPKDESGKLLKGLQRHPTIEDEVTIYAHAMVLGGKTQVKKGAIVGGNATIFGEELIIGEGARIGSNAFVSESVDPGATVVANTTTL
jgi:serine O-acetyltransferase